MPWWCWLIAFYWWLWGIYAFWPEVCEIWGNIFRLRRQLVGEAAQRTEKAGERIAEPKSPKQRNKEEK